jgi:hypothetical protein
MKLHFFALYFEGQFCLQEPGFPNPDPPIRIRIRNAAEKE